MVSLKYLLHNSYTKTLDINSLFPHKNAKKSPISGLLPYKGKKAGAGGTCLSAQVQVFRGAEGYLCYGALVSIAICYCGYAIVEGIAGVFVTAGLSVML